MESRVVVSLWGSAWALDRHRADLWPHHLLAVWLRAKKWKLGLLIWQRVHWGGDVSSCPTCDEHSVCWDLASSCVFSLAQINFYENSLQVCTFLHRQSQDNLEGSKSKKVPIRKKITWRWKNVKKKKKSEPMETALNSQASGLQDVLAAFASSHTHTISPSHLRHATSQFCQGRSKTSHHLINICRKTFSVTDTKIYAKSCPL